MDYTYKYMNPQLTERVSHLYDITYKKPNLPTFYSKILYNEYTQMLEELEKNLMKINKFNFIINNIPKKAMEQNSKKNVKITYSNMRETLSQFGKVQKIEIYHGTVYVQFITFQQAFSTHELINNMQLGENIIKTKVI